MRIADYIGRYWAGAEVMYGIIITMTFTSMIRGFPDMPGFLADRLILAAVLCCIAWGLADGFFYLWERSYLLRRQNRILDLSRSADGVAAARSSLGDELDDTILRTVPEKDRTHFYEKLVRYLSTVEGRQRILPHEAATIITGTLALSAGTALIIVSPFFAIPDERLALTISNLAGILILFSVGYFRARDRNFFPRMLIGTGSALVGIIIVAITVFIGG